MKAKLTFTNRDSARDFGSAWVRFSLRGYDLSATGPDGTTTVTVHNLTDPEKQWIDTYVTKSNQPA